jgi:hypothetical protein
MAIGALRMGHWMTRRVFLYAALLAAMPMAGYAEQGRSSVHWRAATEAELTAALPARAPVVNERIETEMRSATGITDGHNHILAAVVLITAGYAANGKYSHYLLTQTSLRIGADIKLQPGAYVVGWTRTEAGLLVHIYDAATGVERGSLTAHILAAPVQVVPVKIWSPAEKSIIQIGRFALPYALQP